MVLKDALYVDHLNRIIFGLHSSGIMSHFFAKDISLKWLHYTKPTISTEKTIKLRVYYTSFMFLSVMLTLAMLTFMVELLVGNVAEKGKRKLGGRGVL